MYFLLSSITFVSGSNTACFWRLPEGAELITGDLYSPLSSFPNFLFAANFLFACLRSAHGCSGIKCTITFPEHLNKNKGITFYKVVPRKHLL